MDYSRIKPETVAWAYGTARDLLQGELDRIRSLTEKAAQLAGFAGIILAILGTLAAEAFATDLGAIGDVVFAACFFAGAAVLAGAILWLVLLVYRPRRYIAVDTEEIQNYLTDDRLLRSQPWALQIRTMRTIYLAARVAERGAAQMASRITVGAVLFLLGLMLFLGAVITLGAGSL